MDKANSMIAMPRSGVSFLERLALTITQGAERWYPDALVFAVNATAVVALGCLAIGASPISIEQAFGDGFSSIVPFTLQVCVAVLTGYVAANSAPAAWLNPSTRCDPFGRDVAL